MLGAEAHAYERDLHLILDSRGPGPLSGSTLMETALSPTENCYQPRDPNFSRDWNL
jgi:hypothetical protein